METMNAMQEVTGGATETADAVQNQLEMTTEIQNNVDEVRAVLFIFGKSSVYRKSISRNSGRVLTL
jgi:hypothetical protein